MSDELLIAILAAGASRRLGQPKQLVQIGNELLLRRQCRIAIESQIGPVAAIVGCHADRCAASIADLPVTVYQNENWEEGLAASIRAAARAAREAGAEGLLILHCDQYRVRGEDLQALHTAWTKAGKSKICRARYESYAGPPVIFPCFCFPELLTLRGDEGARRVIAAFGFNSLVDVQIPNALYDLDLPEQLADLGNA